MKDTNKIFDYKYLHIYWAKGNDNISSRYRNPDRELSQINNGEESDYTWASYPLETVILDEDPNLWIILDFENGIYPSGNRYFLPATGDLIISINMFGSGRFVNGSNAIIAFPQGTKIELPSSGASYDVNDPYVENMIRLSYDIRDRIFREVIILNYLNVELFVALFALIVTIMFGLISFFQRK